MQSPQVPKRGIGPAASVAFFAAAVILLVGGWQITRAYDTALMDAERSVKTLTHALGQHAARTIEGVDLVVSGAVERVEGNPDHEHLNGYLERRVGYAPEILSLSVSDARGVWVANSASDHTPVDSSDREFFTWHRDHPTHDLHIGAPILSRFSGKSIIPLSRRLDNADGSFAGVVMAAMRPEALQSFYQSVNIGSRGAISLFDADINLFARFPPLKAAAKPDPARHRQMVQVLRAPFGVSRMASVYDGIDRIFSFEHVEGYPLIISTSIAIDEALAGWRREATIEGVVLACAAVVLAALGMGLERQRRSDFASKKVARDLNRQYQLLTENSTDLIALKPSFSGGRAYVSPSCRAILGWLPEEFVTLANERFIHPEDIDRVAGEFASLTPDNPRVTSLQRVLHKDGHVIWLEVDLHLTGSGTPEQSIVVAARDVTVRHEAQQALIESEARYRLLADASSDMIQRLDLDGSRRYVSPAALEIFGLDPTDMLGTHPLDYVHPEDVDRVGTLIGDVAAGRRDQARSIHRIRHSDGHWVWVEVQFRLVRDKASGHPVEIVSNLRDVTERETLQRQLEKANHSLRMAEEIAHVGHWRREVVDGKLIWSDEVYKIYGHDATAASIPHDDGPNPYHPEDRDHLARFRREVMEEGTDHDCNVRIVRPGGEIRHVTIRALREVDPRTGQLTAIFGVVMDVTDVAEADRNVREKSALLEATLDNMDQALVKVAADGTIELFNRRFADLLDDPAALLEGTRPNFEDVPEHLRSSSEDDRTDGTVQVDVATRGAPMTAGTYERSRPDGTVLEVRTVPVSNGAVVRTYTDITARRQAEAAMRESEAKHRVLAETTNDIITRLGLDFTRDYVSGACRRVLGYEPEEMVGLRPSASIHPDDVGEVHALASRLAAGEIDGDRVVATYRALHKDGHWVWLESGMNLVRDETSGTPICLICTLRDVTERQRAARHLEAARAAAEQAGRAKADFLANMSHELRTPLTGILGIHDLLRVAPGLGPDHRRLVALATEAGRSLLAIVNDVLDFSKIEAGELAIESLPFALRTLLDNCRSLASEGLAGKPLTITLHTADDLPQWFVGDAARLRQILLNLLSNAVKFTERGTIRVGAVYDRRTGRLKVEVVDTGIGVPLDKMPTLFDRFSQADASITRKYGGTGLGLAICKRLAELMSGSIGAESTVGRGSTFWFETPLRVDDSELHDEAPAAEPARSGGRILLAEDNRMNSEIIGTMLSQRGYVVTMVADGAAAVEAMGAAGAFDLILMDLQMPVMDGLSATAAIRKRERAAGRSPIPIVGLTANALAEDARRCLASGMNAHVAKPIQWSDLFATMARLIEPSVTLKGADHPPPERSAVLDERILEELARVIGRARLATMLRLFEEDLDRRIQALNVASPALLAEQVHSLIGLAGQLGFVSLSQLCRTIEVAARQNQGLDRIADLRAAAVHAAEAARASRFASAA